MKITFVPKTILGKWSVVLIILFLSLLGLFFLLVHLGERGGATFFSNMKLTTPMLIAAASAFISFFAGIISMIKHKERSALVVLSTLMGLFVIWFVSAEILFPH